jgi:hypothetical protein
MGCFFGGGMMVNNISGSEPSYQMGDEAQSNQTNI